VIHTYSHIARVVYGQPWAILPEKLEEIAAILEFHAAGGRYSAEEIQARTGGPRKPASAAVVGAVAVIPVYGVIQQRATLMSDTSGGTSCADIAGMLKQAMADPSVGSILLDISSPGGSVAGVPELHQQILDARATKPVVALANAQAASAAYWLASAAGEIVVTPSGEVGAIGVYTTHMDKSAALKTAGVQPTIISAGKYKVEGNPFGPLTDEARAAMQEAVDSYYGMFCAAVAAGRGTTPSAVRGGMGQGRMVGAKAAVAAGMADRVGTFDQTVARMASAGRQAPRARAEDPAPEILAHTPPEAAPEAPAASESPAPDYDLLRRRLAFRRH
jgi:capsid assembly protease